MRGEQHRTNPKSKLRISYFVGFLLSTKLLNRTMKLKKIAIAVAAFISIPLSSTLLPAVATPASSPFNISLLAYRGQIEGIPGYDQLHMDLMQNNITAAEIIRAAGYEPTEELARDVRDFIHSFGRND